MKIYQYDSVTKANQALGSFDKSGIIVHDCQVVVVDNKPVFFFSTTNENKVEFDEKKVEVELAKLPKKEIKTKAKEKV